MPAGFPLGAPQRLQRASLPGCPRLALPKGRAVQPCTLPIEYWRANRTHSDAGEDVHIPPVGPDPLQHEPQRVNGWGGPKPAKCDTFVAFLTRLRRGQVRAGEQA
jgi:hypothetical protein